MTEPAQFIADPRFETVADRRQLEAGDRVAVDDPALEQLGEIFRQAEGEAPPPNNQGVVERVYREDNTLVIVFDDGGSAPYPASQVRRIV